MLLTRWALVGLFWGVSVVAPLALIVSGVCSELRLIREQRRWIEEQRQQAERILRDRPPLRLVRGGRS